ncbi:MAG: hypothetical protein NVS9B3_16330 [Gemmatimonadaceae bacterium]
MDRAHAWHVRARVTATVAAGAVGYRALATTWRVTTHGADPLVELRRTGVPIVFAFWHAHILPLLWHHRGEGVSVLISEHRDGEIVARMATALGYGLVRGSTRRGAGRALLGITRALQEGSDVAISPDGPRGPPRVFQPGALVAAHRAGAPVMLVNATADRAWQLRSWDRFLIPKPFARVQISYAGPFFVEAESARDAAAAGDRFGALLEALRPPHSPA